ncbi:MAG: prepilin-type N-terminal cleavage/methylation domain-containing protein [Candidatus Omnitrophica bacterium]|nr:prepilin-type N-terminal cleavage/methylation domain-containing protein [Candidatus Omnitrophota bacterium]
MTEKKINAGFTLFEMIVVVTIIGLIMTIVLPNYIEARNKARANICASNQKIIYTAATTYMIIEDTSLETLGHKERLDELVNKRYLKGDKWTECPSSMDGSYDDYTLEFEGGILADIECDIDPAGHKWP